MAPPAELAAALDAAAECEQALRAAGLVHAAAHTHAAAASLRAARRSVLQRSAAAALPSRDAPPDGITPLILEDGRDTGFGIAAIDGLIGRKVPLGAASVPPLASIAADDLGWDLVGSSAARRFAADDVDAALLQAGLAATGWVAPERAARWATSRTGAATVLRLLRGGRAAPTLADQPGMPLDASVLDLVRSLGWRPERLS